MGIKSIGDAADTDRALHLHLLMMMENITIAAESWQPVLQLSLPSEQLHIITARAARERLEAAHAAKVVTEAVIAAEARHDPLLPILKVNANEEARFLKLRKRP